MHFLASESHEAFDEFEGAFADVKDALDCWRAGGEDNKRRLREAFAGKVTPLMCVDCMAVFQSDNAELKKVTLNMGSRGKIVSWGAAYTEKHTAHRVCHYTTYTTID